MVRFDSWALALGIGFATTLGLSAAEVSMRDVARRWIGSLLDVIEKLFLVGDKAGSKVVYVEYRRKGTLRLT